MLNSLLVLLHNNRVKNQQSQSEKDLKLMNYQKAFIGFLLFVPVLAWSDMMLQKFPLAEIVGQEDRELSEYRFVTGKLSSIGALVRTEKAVMIAGTLNKRTYEIPRVHKTKEIIEHYQVQLQKLKANRLFYCEGRNCGRSNDWANEIFKERILYGPDRYQYYLAATFNHEGRHYAVVVYTIRRGNQRVYAHVEQVELDEPVSADEQASDGFLVAEEDISGLRETKGRLQAWLTTASRQEEPTVTIVTYSNKPNRSSAENLKHAASLGRTLKVYLARELLSEERIQVINLGSFAPQSRFAQHDSFLELYVN